MTYPLDWSKNSVTFLFSLGVFNLPIDGFAKEGSGEFYKVNDFNNTLNNLRSSLVCNFDLPVEILEEYVQLNEEKTKSVNKLRATNPQYTSLRNNNIPIDRDIK